MITSFVSFRCIFAAYDPRSPFEYFHNKNLRLNSREIFPFFQLQGLIVPSTAKICHMHRKSSSFLLSRDRKKYTRRTNQTYKIRKNYTKSWGTDDYKPSILADKAHKKIKFYPREGGDSFQPTEMKNCNFRSEI